MLGWHLAKRALGNHHYLGSAHGATGISHRPGYATGIGCEDDRQRRHKVRSINRRVHQLLLARFGGFQIDPAGKPVRLKFESINLRAYSSDWKCSIGLHLGWRAILPVRPQYDCQSAGVEGRSLDLNEALDFLRG